MDISSFGKLVSNVSFVPFSSVIVTIRRSIVHFCEYFSFNSSLWNFLSLSEVSSNLMGESLDVIFTSFFFYKRYLLILLENRNFFLLFVHYNSIAL